MSAPFVTQLRTRGDVIQMAPVGTASITVRVEMPEVWDVVRVAVLPAESVLALKLRALAALYPAGEAPEEFVMKLRGFEVLNESDSLATVGAVDGSIFLVTHRRRRPVR
jgi:hypothetical protein